MSKSEVEIAQLAHTILGEPEEHLDRFKEFFTIGVSAEAGQENQTTDIKLRTLALLSATAVLIDIFPSLFTVNEAADEDEGKGKKASKEQLGKLKRAKQIVDLYDLLIQKLSKLKVVRGVCALLKSSVCSPQCLDERRLQHLVSAAVSMSCLQVAGREAVATLRDRISHDVANHVDNLAVVKLIVLAITKEKQPDRLNVLIPLLNGLRLTSPDIYRAKHSGGAMNRELARDLATGRGDYVDARKVKSTEAQILSEAIALYIRVARAAQSGQYSAASIRTCIEGIASNAASVNADLAVELEQELLELSKFYLNKKEDEAMLGAIALSALLNMVKGSSERSQVLAGSVVSAAETLVPVALEQVLSSSSSDGETLTKICKGALGLAAQFGSDKALLAVANALVTSLCIRFDDLSSLAADLLANVAGRSVLVRASLDPEGVLVDGPNFEKVQVSLFHPLSVLVGNLEPSQQLSEKLLGGLSKYCRTLASKERTDAVAAENDRLDSLTVQRRVDILSGDRGDRKRSFGGSSKGGKGKGGKGGSGGKGKGFSGKGGKGKGSGGKGKGQGASKRPRH